MPNYNYGGYPYGSPYQPYTPQLNQQPNMYQQPQMNQYAFVNGIEGAKSFQLQPNQTILLMDSDSPLCYMKTANSVGQSTLRYFRLTEIKEEELKNTNQPVNNEYVLKADFDILNNKVDDLLSKIEKPKEKENK